MNKFIDTVSKDQILRKVSLFAKHKKVRLFLVGGFIRDNLLRRKKTIIDYDFAIKRNAIGFGRALSKYLKSGFVVLDKKHGSCRVVYNKAKSLTLDFTDFRGRTLDEDLMFRDFTLNSLSIDLNNIQNGIYDPLGGLNDIKKRMIRLCCDKSIPQDPVRILRAFSLSAIFGFKIDKKVVASIKKEKSNLNNVAFERVRDELFKILDTNNALKIIKELDRFKILEIIIPEIKSCFRVNQGPYHHLDVWEHSLVALEGLEKILNSTRSKNIIEHLNEIIAQCHKRKQLIKLAALLHDIGKPKAKRRIKNKLIFHGHEALGAKMMLRISQRLKLSVKENDYLRRLVWFHLRPGYLADLSPLSERAVFRFFRDAKSEALDILLVSLADQRATRGRLNTRKSRVNHERLCAKLIRRFLKDKSSKPFVRFVDGNDMLKLGLSEGPIVGEFLKELEELQAEGKIKSRQQALKKAKAMIKKIK
ncbi:MAG: HD domain-containing protein [Candidatus Gygaella obscura]|nr:HD domain-containing protein [Candidatus Gygaella obscura]